MTTILEREAKPEIIHQFVTDFDHLNYQYVRDDQWRWKVRELIRSLRHAEVRVETQLEDMRRSLRERAWLAKIWDTMQGIMEVSAVVALRKKNTQGNYNFIA